MILMHVDSGQPVPGKLVYRVTDYAFATEPRPESTGASLTVNELELMLGHEGGRRVVFVEGYCPHANWRLAALRPPRAVPGILGADAGSIHPGEAIAVHPVDDRWPVVVDPSTGWVRLGKGTPLDDGIGVEFAPGAIAIVTDRKLAALWLRPDQLPRVP